MSEEPFESLIESRHIKERWNPTHIYIYEYAIKLDTTLENAYALRKNIAYSLQYLEFLEKELAELKLTSVLYVMIYKSYVITSMSILECIFASILKEHGWWSTSDLESQGAVKTSEANFNGQKYVVKTELFRTVAPFDLQMNLDTMIQKLNHHHEALGVDHVIYPALRRLKDLRNRVHLQKVDSYNDHDYNAFDFNVKKEMGQILHEVLTSSAVTDRTETFDFLKVNCDGED